VLPSGDLIGFGVALHCLKEYSKELGAIVNGQTIDFFQDGF